MTARMDAQMDEGMNEWLYGDVYTHILVFDSSTLEQHYTPHNDDWCHEDWENEEDCPSESTSAISLNDKAILTGL